MKHLTTSEDIKNTLSRFVSNKLDNDRIEPYIAEAELLFVKKQIGEFLYLDIRKYISSEDKSLYPDYSTLLNGGIYTVSGCDGVVYEREFSGLLKALGYYVWSLLVKNNTFTITRYSVSIKEDQYSTNATHKEKDIQSKGAIEVGDEYLRECIEYLNNNRNAFPLFKRYKISDRFNMKIIGD